MSNLFLIGGNIFAAPGGGVSSALRLPIALPFMYCADPEEGRPLVGAQIYIGLPGLDPEIPANQQAVTAIDENGTSIPMTQPIVTGAGGIPLYNGGPIQLYVTSSSAYSLKILDSLGVQEYYAPDIAAIETIDPATLNDYALLDSPTFIGDPKAPTPLPGDNDTSIATTAFVQTLFSGAAAIYAPIADPVFTGDPQAPTPAPGDNDNSLATTAFVQNAITISGFAFKGFAATDPSGAPLVGTTELTVNTTQLPSLAEDHDTNSWFDPVTGIFLPNIAGYYEFAMNASVDEGLVSPTAGTVEAYIKLNGSIIRGAATVLVNDLGSGKYSTVNFSTRSIYMNGTTDSVQFYFNSVASGNYKVDWLSLGGKFVGT